MKRTGNGTGDRKEIPVEEVRRLLEIAEPGIIDKGKLPASEMETIGRMVEDISYNNADRYFGF